MPKKLDDCVQRLLKKGYSKEKAYAICNAMIQNANKYKNKRKKKSEVK